MTEFICEAYYEPTQGYWTACELLHFLLNGRSGSLEHDFYLGWVHFNSSLSHHKTEKLARTDVKHAFEPVKFHVVLSYQPKHLFQMLNVFYACFAFDDYVINIHFHYLAYQQLKNFHHQPLVCCFYILEPKKHDVVAIQSLRCDESRFLFIQLEWWFSGTWKRHQGRKAFHVWALNRQSDQSGAKWSYSLGKNHLGLCNPCILAMFLFSLRPPQHWPISPDRWLPK